MIAEMCAFRKRRCLVPASGFYEWKKLDARTKQPYFIHRADGQPAVMAGLWESWNESAASGSVETFTILTTQANNLIPELHDRMPVFLGPDHFERWLDPDCRDVAALHPLLKSAPALDRGALGIHWALQRKGDRISRLSRCSGCRRVGIVGAAINCRCRAITDSGLLERIRVDEAGRIVDGRCRLLACHAVGAEPRFVTCNDDPSAIAFGNVARRHLNVVASSILSGEAGDLAILGFLHLAQSSGEILNRSRGAGTRQAVDHV